MKKQLKKLKQDIAEQGFVVDENGRHIKVRTTAGGLVYTLPATASDHRSLLNAVSGLRRAGVLPNDYRLKG